MYIHILYIVPFIVLTTYVCIWQDNKGEMKYTTAGAVSELRNGRDVENSYFPIPIASYVVSMQCIGKYCFKIYN